MNCLLALLLLLDGTYTVEVSANFHSALLHFLDSVAAVDPPVGTAGKTVTAHRRMLDDAVGPPSAEDVRILQGFRAARLAYSRAHPDDAHGLTRAFFDSGDLDAALAAADAMLDEEHVRALRAALERFAPRYRTIWRDGLLARQFLERSSSGKRARALSRFLADVATFYGVSPTLSPRPQVILAPVERGYGTHAQALDRFLLVEIRRGEDLFDQVAPIVHENAHFLFGAIDADRLASLERGIAGVADGPRVWRLLKEALPTAIAQGVAAERFQRDDWSRERRWYHVDEIDAYAKRLFPQVKRALAERGSLDAAFLERAVAVYAESTRR